MLKHAIIFFVLFFSSAVAKAGTKDTCKNLVQIETFTPKDTFNLKESGRIFYMFDCDSIYAVLEQPYQLFILHSLPSKLAEDYFRLGFQFIKEFDDAVLFQTYCPAMGPCLYGLVSKDFGLVYQTFEGLIYDGKEDSTSIIIYFSSDNYISIYDVNTQNEQKFMYPANRFDSPFPEYQFTKISWANNDVILDYNYVDKFGKKQLDKLKFTLKKL